MGDQFNNKGNVAKPGNRAQGGGSVLDILAPNSTTVHVERYNPDGSPRSEEQINREEADQFEKKLKGSSAYGMGKLIRNVFDKTAEWLSGASKEPQQNPVAVRPKDNANSGDSNREETTFKPQKPQRQRKSRAGQELRKRAEEAAIKAAEKAAHDAQKAANLQRRGPDDEDQPNPPPATSAQQSSSSSSTTPRAAPTTPRQAGSSSAATTPPAAPTTPGTRDAVTPTAEEPTSAAASSPARTTPVAASSSAAASSESASSSAITTPEQRSSSGSAAPTTPAAASSSESASSSAASSSAASSSAASSSAASSSVQQPTFSITTTDGLPITISGSKLSAAYRLYTSVADHYSKNPSNDPDVAEFMREYKELKTKIQNNDPVTAQDISEIDAAFVNAGLDLSTSTSSSSSPAPATVDATSLDSLLNRLEPIILQYIPSNATALDQAKGEAFGAMKARYNQLRNSQQEGQAVTQADVDSFVGSYLDFLNPSVPSTTERTSTTPPPTIPADSVALLKPYYQTFFTNFKSRDPKAQNPLVKEYNTLFNHNYPTRGTHVGAYLQEDFNRMNSLAEEITIFFARSSTTSRPTTTQLVTINVQNPVVRDALGNINDFVGNLISSNATLTSAQENLVNLNQQFIRNLYPQGNQTAARGVTLLEYNNLVQAFNTVINARDLGAGAQGGRNLGASGRNALIALGTVALAALAIIGACCCFRENNRRRTGRIGIAQDRRQSVTATAMTRTDGDQGRGSGAVPASAADDPAAHAPASRTQAGNTATAAQKQNKKRSRTLRGDLRMTPPGKTGTDGQTADAMAIAMDTLDDRQGQGSSAEPASAATAATLRARQGELRADGGADPFANTDVAKLLRGHGDESQDADMDDSDDSTKEVYRPNQGHGRARTVTPTDSLLGDSDDKPNREKRAMFVGLAAAMHEDDVDTAATAAVAAFADGTQAGNAATAAILPAQRQMLRVDGGETKGAVSAAAAGNSRSPAMQTTVMHPRIPTSMPPLGQKVDAKLPLTTFPSDQTNLGGGKFASHAGASSLKGDGAVIPTPPQSLPKHKKEAMQGSGDGSRDTAMHEGDVDTAAAAPAPRTRAASARAQSAASSEQALVGDVLRKIFGTTIPDEDRLREFASALKEKVAEQHLRIMTMPAGIKVKGEHNEIADLAKMSIRTAITTQKSNDEVKKSQKVIDNINALKTAEVKQLFEELKIDFESGKEISIKTQRR